MTAAARSPCSCLSWTRRRAAGWDHRAIYVVTLAVRDPEVARPVSDLSHTQIR